jgi:uncharacterized protein (TIGR03083 family)
MKVPIQTVHLFPVIDKMLIALLRSLTPEEWSKPTIAKLWTVKDIAAHLLDTNLRTLSMSRDNYLGLQPPQINSFEELVAYLNQLNADWVTAAKRVSPQLLTDQLELTGKQFCDHIASLDPFGEAVFSVAWAGEDKSENWFHIAREYTEKWIHQQQIRDAVDKPGLMTKELFYPFIDTFMQALPHTYRNIKAAEDTVIKITVTTEIGGDWFLIRNNVTWKLSYTTDFEPTTTVSIPPGIAWKLFSKGITSANAGKDIAIRGDELLGEKVLTMVSVMA